MREIGQRFIIGAAIGSGMGAIAAEQAGADFLLALSAGRLRTMGVPSPASLLPIYSGSAFVVEFARKELIGRTRLPLYLGIPAFDPRIDQESLFDQLSSIGVAGVVNFPSLIHFGDRRKILKEQGISLDREIEFLSAARAFGFATIGYVRNSDDARAMTLANIDAICMNFILNPGKPGADKDYGVRNEILARSTDILKAVRAVRPSAVCLLGGGPIADATDFMDYCRSANVQGFIGGSTLDQLPLEQSLVDTVKAFRSIRELQSRVDQLEDQLQQLGRRYGLVAQSTVMNRTLQHAVKLARGHGHLWVSGELGTGRQTIAQLIVQQAHLKGREVVSLDYMSEWDQRFCDKLFGTEGTGNTKRMLSYLEIAAIVIVRCHAPISIQIQRRLGHFLQTGQFKAEGGRRTLTSDARLIFIAEDGIAGVLDSGQASEAFATCFRGHDLVVPPLRDRIEDIPFLFKQYAAALSSDDQMDFDIENDVVKVLLRHDWPRNLIEFKEAVDWMVNERKMTFSARELSERLGRRGQKGGQRKLSERDMIIDALLRNNLRRADTASFLGISRKTLYNKIKKYGIFA